MLPCKARKAMSPVVASVILLAVVIAVSLATVAWISGLSTSYMQIEELHATNHQWGPNISYVDVTLHNTGTQSVKLSSVSVNSQPATSVIYIVGSSQIGNGESAVLRISDTFVPGATYQFVFQTVKGTKFFYIATAEVVSSIFRMEWGTVTADDTFKTVTLQQIYSSPIIVCSPVYTSGLPRTVRLTDVSPNSFKVRVQNPSNATLPETTVNYLVVEEGEWTAPFKIEAKKYQTSTVGQNNDWNYDLRSYGQSYSGNVIVLHQVMSNNDPTWITSYVSKANSKSNPPSSGDASFRIALNGAEAVDTHGAEDVGYIVIQEGYDVLNGIKWEAKQTADTIQGLLNLPPYSTSFDQTFSAPPNVALAFQQEMDGGNGGWALVYSTSSTQLGLACDEDQVSDFERSHITETCGFIVFENAGSYSQ
jgi:flagellin-like protein